MCRVRGRFSDARAHIAVQAALATSLAALSLLDTSSTDTAWNLDVLMGVLGHDFTKLDPERFAEALDHEAFALPDGRAFLTLMSQWRRATADKAFPLPAVIGRAWKNAPGQISFLRFATAAPPELFSFEGAQRKLPPVEGLQVDHCPLHFSHSWNYPSQVTKSLVISTSLAMYH